MMDLEELRYPIGRFIAPAEISVEQLAIWLNEIESCPIELIELTQGLSETDLQKKYRPNGWTIKQVIHHMADSHTNSFMRFKWALTENSPKIKAYDEVRWASLVDYESPIQYSLDYLKTLHAKWIFLMRSLTAEDWFRTWQHPSTQAISTLGQTVGHYAWHGKHHLAHIRLSLIH